MASALCVTLVLETPAATTGTANAVLQGYSMEYCMGPAASAQPAVQQRGPLPWQSTTRTLPAGSGTSGLQLRCSEGACPGAPGR